MIYEIDLADSTNSCWYYYNDKWQVTCQYDIVGGAESLGREFVYGNYIDEVLVMRDRADVNPVSYYYGHDQLYSPVVLVNSSGSIEDRYEYDAYGACRVLNADYTADSDGRPDCGNPYLFTGREVDYLDSGSLALQYNRHRYYSQSLGRWMSEDPAEYVDDLNLYQYCISEPVHLGDPFGLKANGALDATIGAMRLIAAIHNYLYGFGKDWHRNEWSVDVEETGGFELIKSNLEIRIKNKAKGLAGSLSCNEIASVNDITEAGESSSLDALAVAPLGRFMIYAKASCAFKKDCARPKCHCKAIDYSCSVSYRVADKSRFHQVWDEVACALLAKLDSPVRTLLLFWGKAGREVALNEMGGPHPFMIYVDWPGAIEGTTCPKD